MQAMHEAENKGAHTIKFLNVQKGRVEPVLVYYNCCLYSKYGDPSALSITTEVINKRLDSFMRFYQRTESDVMVLAHHMADMIFDLLGDYVVFLDQLEIVLEGIVGVRNNYIFIPNEKMTKEDKERQLEIQAHILPPFHMCSRYAQMISATTCVCFGGRWMG